MKTHHTEFEANLLKLIDGVLQSNPTFEEFVQFNLNFGSLYDEATNDATWHIESKLASAVRQTL